jgi:hypothetical protein
MSAGMQRWGLFIHLFLASVDRSTGSLLHLPRGGGVMDQPLRELNIILYLQSIFCEIMAKREKAAAQKGSMSRGRRRGRRGKR